VSGSCKPVNPIASKQKLKPQFFVLNSEVSWRVTDIMLYIIVVMYIHNVHNIVYILLCLCCTYMRLILAGYTHAGWKHKSLSRMCHRYYYVCVKNDLHVFFLAPCVWFILRSREPDRRRRVMSYAELSHCAVTINLSNKRFRNKNKT